MDKQKRLVIIALMLVTFLAAFEGTVVSTAMPTIANDLDGYSLISWIFSAYLLTSAIFIPIYGKVSDMIGRKKILTVGIIIFLIGTTLSGFSQTMVYLIISRSIQGVGAGAILTLTYTIIGDLFETSEKIKIQGWLSTIWGVSSLLGPFLGGLILAKLTWHWIFFVNIPFGLAGIYMINKNLKENIEKKKVAIDFIGIILLSISITSLLFGFLELSNIYLLSIYLIIFIISLIGFIIAEGRVKDPLVPFNIFNKPSIIANVLGFIVSMIIIAIQTYMPIYTQDVLGYSPLASGLFLAPLSFAWFLSSFILAKTLIKYGERICIFVAIIILLLTLIVLNFLNLSTPIYILIVTMFIMGFGFGGIINSTLIVVQNSVEPSERGVSISTLNLIRTIGQTVGVSIFGGILNSEVAKYFSSKGYSGVTINDLSSTNNIFNLTIEQIKDGFLFGVHNIFVILIVLGIICVFFGIFIPKRKVL